MWSINIFYCINDDGKLGLNNNNEKNTEDSSRNLTNWLFKNQKLMSSAYNSFYFKIMTYMIIFLIFIISFKITYHDHNRYLQLSYI